MNSNNTSNSYSEKEQYEKFLLSEYDHIAEAHFNMVNSITSFFRYLILIASIPAPLLAIILKPSEGGSNYNFIQSLAPYLVFIAFIISILGFMVLCYVVNLRFDAILYARQVNGIRNYFYGLCGNSGISECEIRVLPRTIDLPEYTEKHYFMYVVKAFAMVNSIYFGAAVYFIFVLNFVKTIDCIFFGFLSGVIFFIINVSAYFRIAKFRETKYLKVKK